MIGKKEVLYNEVDSSLKKFGVTEEWYPLNIFQVIRQIPDIFVEFLSYTCSHIGAVMLRGQITGIAVNALKPFYDQNFDVAHELVHYLLHPDTSTLNLSEPAKSQNRMFEWQANEGAAQMLVPYQDFIPRFINKAAEAEENYYSAENIYFDLAEHYHVNPVVIDYRIRNLDNEILQFHTGTPLNDIRLSNNVYLYNKHKKLSVYQSLLDKLSRHSE